jgi:hypothetical protein
LRGIDHEAAPSLGRAGVCLYWRGRYTDAEPLLERELAICEKVLGPEHPNVAASLNRLFRDWLVRAPSTLPMQIHSDFVNSLRSDVGFRLFYQWQVGKVIIEPSLKAAWEHEYLYLALPITAGFAGRTQPGVSTPGTPNEKSSP